MKPITVSQKSFEQALQMAEQLATIPNIPTCPNLWSDVKYCQSVEAVKLAMAAHLGTCIKCREKQQQTARRAA